MYGSIALHGSKDVLGVARVSSALAKSGICHRMSPEVKGITMDP